MNRNKLNFDSENLVVDFLTFNIESKEPERLQKVADYFSKNFQCNSVLIDVQDSTKTRVLSQKHKKCCKAEFRTNYTKYWPGTIISFSGNHARFFYEAIKIKQFDKEIFDLDSTNIGRIDLCYDRKIQPSDQTQNLDSFLKNCYTKINSKADAPKAKIVKGVLRVGKRSSPNYFRVYPKPNGKFIRFELELKKSAIKKFQYYFFLNQFEKLEELLVRHFYKEAISKLDVYSPYADWLIENFRIYQKKDGLEFELEIKKTPLKSFQDLLFSGQIQQFESESSYYFLKSFANIFPISYCFMDWLAVSLRPKISHSNLVNPLISEYIQVDNFISVADKKHLFLLLQLLSFLQPLDAYEEFIREQSYFIITFRVQEFLKFIYSDTEVYNHYQLTKTVQFLKALQTIEPLVTYFSDTSFRSVVAFPYLLVEKQAKYWNVTLAIAKELYFYQYPFQFPNFFVQYRNKYDFEVKLEIIRVFSTNNTEKIFQTEIFLKQFRVPNKCRSDIKKIILELISELQILDIIESNYKILSNGLYHQVNHLTLSNISKSFIFYEKLILDI